MRNAGPETKRETRRPAGLDRRYGDQFGDRAVVEAYIHRPTYPPQTATALASLLRPGYPVLDIGCGPGPIARTLVSVAPHVDAVDPAPAMLAVGRTQPGGGHPGIRWIEGYAEDVPLTGPYGLIVAGSSLHWMEWDIVLPRFRSWLAPRAMLAIVQDVIAPSPWEAALSSLIGLYSTNREFQPYDLLSELTVRGLFQIVGRRRIGPVPFTQSLAAYVESFHARNGFSRQRMPRAEAAAFDVGIAEAVSRHLQDGQVTLAISADIAWGTPLAA